MFIQVDQLDARILIICLYLSLSALHISDSSPSSEATFWSCISLLVLAGTISLVVPTQQPDLPANTSCDIQLQNIAPDDGLESTKHVEHLMINKDIL